MDDKLVTKVNIIDTKVPSSSELFSKTLIIIQRLKKLIVKYLKLIT